MAQRSKRTTRKEFTTKSGEVVTEGYCRHCMKTKPPQDFFSAIDFYLDKNGLFSICKECINDIIYPEAYAKEKVLSKTLLSVCRTLNVAYYEDVMASVRAQITKAQKKGKKSPPPFSLYKLRLATMFAKGFDFENSSDYDLTFREPFQLSEDPEEIERLSGNAFWGTNLTEEDIEFLEERFSNFKKTHTTDTAAEIELLKLVCHNLLDIDRARSAGKSTITEVKQLQQLMKTLAVSPDMQTEDANAKNLETYGLKIKYIEERRPAELLDEIGRSKYEDSDDYRTYYENFVKRPTINYNAGISNYTILNEDGEEEDWEIKD